MLGLVWSLEAAYLVWSLEVRLIWFVHSEDTLSGLVTWEMSYLVWSLRRRLVWFQLLGRHGSDLTQSVGRQLVRKHCLI